MKLCLICGEICDVEETEIEYTTGGNEIHSACWYNRTNGIMFDWQLCQDTIPPVDELIELFTTKGRVETLKYFEKKFAPGKTGLLTYLMQLNDAKMITDDFDVVIDIVLQLELFYSPVSYT